MLEHKPRAITADLESVLGINRAETIHNPFWHLTMVVAALSSLGKLSWKQFWWQPYPMSGNSGKSWVSVPPGGSSSVYTSPLLQFILGLSSSSIASDSSSLNLWQLLEATPNPCNRFLSWQDEQESISDSRILWIQKSSSRPRNQPRPAEQQASPRNFQMMCHKTSWPYPPFQSQWTSQSRHRVRREKQSGRAWK